MAIKGPERWTTGIAMPNGVSGAMQAVGGFFSMSMDAVLFVFRRPFQWREFLEQCWFVAKVSMAPTLLVALSTIGLMRAVSAGPATRRK